MEKVHITSSLSESDWCRQKVNNPFQPYNSKKDVSFCFCRSQLRRKILLLSKGENSDQTGFDIQGLFK